jgi:hypothetical protein
MFATPIGYLIDEQGAVVKDVAVGVEPILALADEPRSGPVRSWAEIRATAARAATGPLVERCGVLLTRPLCGLPEWRYFDTTASSVVGIVGLQRYRRLLHCSIRPTGSAGCASYRVEKRIAPASPRLASLPPEYPTTKTDALSGWPRTRPHAAQADWQE